VSDRIKNYMANAAARARHIAEKKAERPAPAPADAPPVEVNPYQRLLKKLDAEKAARTSSETKAGK